MTFKQIQKATQKEFGDKLVSINMKNETVIAGDVLYTCSTMSGKPRFYEIAKVAA
jgi:hypothetical protein